MTDAIVLSSFAVHPDMSSEPGVGWQFLLATLEYASSVECQVILVTIRRSEIACRGRIPERFVPYLEIVPVDIPLSPRFFRWHYPRFTRVEHEVWVRLAGRRMEEIERRVTVVYAHHVTFATEILSTPITRLSSRSYKVWGPVGAGGVADVYAIDPVPPAARRQYVLQKLRDAVARLPATAVARRCNVVLAQNVSAEMLLAHTGTECRQFPNVVVDTAEVDRTRPNHGGLEILVVGHLIARKRQELAVEALASPLLAEAMLHIVGVEVTGHAAYLQDLACRLGVESRVVFHGPLPRDAVLGWMIRADVLMHPSGREGASGVVGEAATCGLPVVCFAGTGAASVLEQSGTSGVVLPADASTKREMLADAIVRAARMPRTTTTLWTTERFVELARRLHTDGVAFRNGARVER